MQPLFRNTEKLILWLVVPRDVDASCHKVASVLLKAQFAHLYFCVTSQVDPRRHLSTMDKQLVPVVPHGASFRQVTAGTSAAAVAAYQYQPATSSSSSRPRLDHVPYCNSSSNLRDMALVSIINQRVPHTYTRSSSPPKKKIVIFRVSMTMA